MRFQDPEANAEAQSSPGPGRLGGEKRIKELAANLGSYPRAIVDDTDFQEATALLTDDSNHTILPGRGDSVRAWSELWIRFTNTCVI